MSSPTFMESFLILSSCCQTPTIMNSVLISLSLRKFKLIYIVMSSKPFSRFFNAGALFDSVIFVWMKTCAVLAIISISMKIDVVFTTFFTPMVIWIGWKGLDQEHPHGGTPCLSNLLDDVAIPSLVETLTHWVLLVRKLSIHNSTKDHNAEPVFQPLE